MMDPATKRGSIASELPNNFPVMMGCAADPQIQSHISKSRQKNQENI